MSDLDHAIRDGQAIIFLVTPEERKMAKLSNENKSLKERLDKLENLIARLEPENNDANS